MTSNLFKKILSKIQAFFVHLSFQTEFSTRARIFECNTLANYGRKHHSVAAKHCKLSPVVANQFLQLLFIVCFLLFVILYCQETHKAAADHVKGTEPMAEESSSKVKIKMHMSKSSYQQMCKYLFLTSHYLTCRPQIQVQCQLMNQAV